MLTGTGERLSIRRRGLHLHLLLAAAMSAVLGCRSPVVVSQPPCGAESNCPDGSFCDAGRCVALPAVPSARISAPAAVTRGKGGYTASAVEQAGNTFTWTLAGDDGASISVGQGTSAIGFRAGLGTSLRIGLRVVNAGAADQATATIAEVTEVIAPVIEGPATLRAGGHSREDRQ